MAKDKKSWWLGAIIGGIIGNIVGSVSVVQQNTNPEIKKLFDLIDKKLLEGVEEGALINALIEDARKNMAGPFKEEHADKIRFWVLQEKVRLKEGGKL